MVEGGVGCPFPWVRTPIVRKKNPSLPLGVVSSGHVHSLGLFRIPRIGHHPPSRKCYWRRPRRACSFTGASLQTREWSCREVVLCVRVRQSSAGPFPGSLSQEAPRLRGGTQVPPRQMHIKRKTRQVLISFFKFRVLPSARIFTNLCL